MRVSVILFVCALLPLVSSMRSCRNRLLDRVQIKTNFLHESHFDRNGSIPHLTITVTWEVTGAEQVELDGFLFHMRKFTDALSSNSLLPTNICNLRQKEFWVRSNNTSCDVTTDCATAGGRYCACPLNCTLIPRQFCKGVEEWVKENQMISVQPHVRSLTFYSYFDQRSVFIIYPYVKNAVGTRHEKSFTSRKSPNCVDLLIKSGMRALDAADACCKANITDYTVRSVTFQRPVIDIDSQSVSVMVHWLPPITQRHLTHFGVRVFSSRRYAVSYHANKSTPGRTLIGNKCLNMSWVYFSTLRSLAPSTDYQVQIATYQSKGKTSCVSNTCRMLFSFRTPSVDICDPSFGYCHYLARCHANNGSVWNATCVCHPGYRGNGVSERRQLGTGCVDEDYCSSGLNPCSENARCFDKPAPDIGADCKCEALHTGDGLKAGTGCSSQIGFYVGLAIALAFLLLSIVFLVLRRVWIKRQLANDIQWSEFVANQSLQQKTALLDKMGKEGVCMPTFGEQHELDRHDIILCDVIGRGNCGVVYNAFYNTTDGVSSKITEMVAVKTLQDKSSNHVIDFLSEIGLMLNIGDHPNIIRVVGCCTTQNPILLITEYLEYGDLLHFLWDAREPDKCAEDPTYHLTEKSLYYMSKQVASGMEYLTKSKIIHGDLAARNILVGSNLVCKISDFGLANDVYRYGVIKGQQERCVPYKWISPERMMAGREPITSKSDVWSFGNLMYEMVTLGCAPHTGVSPDELLDKLKSGYRMRQPSTCSATMYSIMSKCWKWHPYSRPSFGDLVRLTGDALIRPHPSGKGDHVTHNNTEKV